MDQKICSNCGTHIPSASAFCPKCGHPQRTVEQPVGQEVFVSLTPEMLACKQCGTKHSAPYPSHCRACGYPLDVSASQPKTAFSTINTSPPIPSPVPVFPSNFAPGPGQIGAESGGLLNKNKTFSRLRVLKALPRRTIIGSSIFLIVMIFILGWAVGNRNNPGSEATKCSPFEPGEGYEAANQNDLKGTLQQNSYMEAGKEYSIAEGAIFTIPSGKALMIEPGARIKFGKGARMVVNGELLACGTRSKRILFTADATTGSPGYWLGIEIKNANGATIIGHANFEFGGMDGHAVIWVEKSDLTLEDVRFESNKSLSISITPDSFPSLISPFTVDNGPTGWEVRGGKLTDDLTWDGEQPLIINGKLEVPKEVTLYINAGSHVKFLPDSSLAVYGKIIASGTSQKRILVTSASDLLADDTSRPSNEAWTGLFFFGDQAQGEFSFVDFQYAGGEEDQ